jgi:PAS domain S-box-containing protein
MFHRESRQKLHKTIKELQKEIQSLKLESKLKNDSAKEMIFKAFHAASHLMALSNLETGSYVDVNDVFLNTLGYNKKEIIGRTSEDIQVFADIEESNKYIKLLSKFRKVKNFPVKLKTKRGEEIPYLFSADSIKVDNEVYLLTTYNEIASDDGSVVRSAGDSILNEIFETVSSYLMLVTVLDDNSFCISNINHKVEEVERVRRSEIAGKRIDDTPLVNRLKLIELLHHLHITGEAHKLSASTLGDDSEGFYMGFPLTRGDIVVTWEPGHMQSFQEKGIIRKTTGFENLANMMPEMIFEIDLAGKITYTNAQGLVHFGYLQEDLDRGVTLADIFPSEELKRAVENLKTINTEKQDISNEYTALKKDGTQLSIITRTLGIFHSDRLVGYRGVVTDISSQKKNEEQIIREKAFLEHLIDSSPQAIVITDIPGKITLINKEFTNIFGYNSEEAVGKYIDDLIVPDELKEEALIIDEKATINKKEFLQTLRIDKYGNKKLVSLIASNIVINDVTVALLGIYRDITTERKNQLLQEILYNISTAALKQFDIKDIYPTIVSELSKIWDTNNFYIAIYDKATQTLSLPFFADEKDDFNEFPAKGSITGWVIRNNKSVLLKEDDLRKIEEAGEIDLVGTPCKVWMGVPLRVEGDIIGVMCLQDYNSEDKFSVEDLNVLDFIANQIAIAIQRRTMLDNLIVARQKAEDAAQSKQQFMSTMSHEIRTPLNEVIGIANLLMQGNPRDDQMDLIKTLRFSGNHLMTLVNDVLDYNKMESGKIVFEQTQFNLVEFLDEIRRSYSFRSNEKKLEFNIVWNNNVPIMVTGDQIRLNQILSNLLSNALKFTLSGGITLNIREIERIGNQSNIEFMVKDTGIGIAAEKHDEIFDSFTQASTDTTRRFGGTGLGLAICKKLVELQGGSIHVESEPDKGASFIFNLLFTVQEKQVPKHKTGVSESFRGLEGKRILVAEDNKINFFVANKFLVGWGVKVTHVENGQLAMEVIEKEEFDLILMDLHMPILDGIEASRRIRKSTNPKIKNIPIVALTAAIMSESHDKIDDLNINDYVLKPFKPNDLYERILKHIK